MSRPKAIVRLSAKARIVVSKRVREWLGIAPGDLLLLQVRDGELILRRAPMGGEPFAVFHEWAGAADADACDAL